MRSRDPAAAECWRSRRVRTSLPRTFPGGPAGTNAARLAAFTIGPYERPHDICAPEIPRSCGLGRYCDVPPGRPIRPLRRGSGLGGPRRGGAAQVNNNCTSARTGAERLRAKSDTQSSPLPGRGLWAADHGLQTAIHGLQNADPGRRARVTRGDPAVCRPSTDSHPPTCLLSRLPHPRLCAQQGRCRTQRVSEDSLCERGVGHPPQGNPAQPNACRCCLVATEWPFAN